MKERPDYFNYELEEKPHKKQGRKEKTGEKQVNAEPVVCDLTFYDDDDMISFRQQIV